MKRLRLFIILSVIVISCEKKITIDKKTGVVQKITDEKVTDLPEELEDCDDKINKVKEEPVKIDLSNNTDEGCTIE